MRQLVLSIFPDRNGMRRGLNGIGAVNFARDRSWRKLEIIVAARRDGLPIAPPPKFTQGLAHGCVPFAGWLQVAAEKRVGASVPRLAALSIKK